jgi:hypothetical protein
MMSPAPWQTKRSGGVHASGYAREGPRHRTGGQYAHHYADYQQCAPYHRYHHLPSVKRPYAAYELDTDATYKL